jgi:hypothetical protein
VLAGIELRNRLDVDGVQCRSKRLDNRPFHERAKISLGASSYRFWMDEQHDVEVQTEACWWTGPPLFAFPDVLLGLLVCLGSGQIGEDPGNRLVVPVARPIVVATEKRAQKRHIKAVEMPEREVYAEIG